MRLAQIDGCAAPRSMYPVFRKLKAEVGVDPLYNSILRTDEAAPILHRSGHHTQSEVIELHAQGVPGYGPANPVDRSAHCLFNDGVAYPELPVGAKLKPWQVGFDVNDEYVDDVERVAHELGWEVRRPYSSGSEYHHLQFVKKPARWKLLYHAVFKSWPGRSKPKPVTRVADAKPAKKAKPHPKPHKHPKPKALPNKVYDSTTVTEIPKTAKAALGYVGGSWPTFENGELRAHLPHARLVSVAVSSIHDADMLDVETGDATPADCPGWFHRQQARKPKTRPKFYGSASVIDQIADALDAAGIHRSQYVLLAAHYGSGKHVCGPKSCGLTKHICDGTQFTDTALGRNLDESYVKPSFWR